MKHILIVDDEPVIRAGLMKLIKQYSQSIQVHAVPNGIEAMELIRKQYPDLVFTDIRMPKMDGLELCRNISQMNSQVRMVVISGYGDFTYAQKCMTFGVKEYMLKPVTKAELYPVLDRFLHEEKSASLSISAYEDWLEQAEAAVWTADFDRLDRLLRRWRGDDLAGRLTTEQLQQTAENALHSLIKKLNRRELLPFVIRSPFTTRLSHKAVLELFESELTQLSDQLVRWRGGNQKSVFEEAKAYIDEHIAEEISLEAVAEKVGLAPTYFSYFFKKKTNETFVQYRMKKRIELAKRLLELPHYKIADIGMEIGYQNHPHFTKIFKKITGTSPSEYRQMLGIK
ncbi:response regulator [Paenibacillus sp. OAS669]|uniref:response regulator transcription factor n=1 Tax=Paenibacillus sp. OAS669 TaxID=2663821 RepID=UPI00178957AF|nr:response regulator [Paenibacillus sp. OAS669]MBE1443428.1 two-component system response regulator YesN [Paenibacillus sp. OAS669]